MKNKIILFVILSLFLVGTFGLTSASLGTFPPNTCVNIQTNLNTSEVTLGRLDYPNSTKVLGITNMEKDGLTFNYTFCNTSTFGKYIYNYNDTEGNVYVNDFIIGYEFNSSTAILSIFILSLLIGALVFSIKGLFKAQEGAWQIFYTCISYVLLFSTFFLLWLFSKYYLTDIQILTSIFWIIWFILAILFFPFMIAISGYVLKKQLESTLEEDYVKQGYTREEAKDMAKRKK
ncbi:MAG: hypothetical protein M0R17_09520 [Candidatus Omnitrophica bacterium]|jgi:hypothetical protein|nr:hypothetical protein [Candidatus Omnitrophota bacterium]